MKEMIVSKYAKSRGHKNNNPYNLNQSSNTWLGKIVPSSDSRFEQFETLEYGIRAGVLNLINAYWNKGLRTIRTIISKYCPPSDPDGKPTDTVNYINAMSKALGVSPDKVLTEPEFYRLAYNIMHHENGYDILQMSGFSVIINKFKLFV